MEPLLFRSLFVSNDDVNFVFDISLHPGRITRDDGIGGGILPGHPSPPAQFILSHRLSWKEPWPRNRLRHPFLRWFARPSNPSRSAARRRLQLPAGTNR